ncbi:MAG: hypothetical protein ACRCZU_06025, partial [Selenomonadaceae bacterium]
FEDDHAVAATFVDLSRVASEEFVAISLAAALGINSEGGDPLQDFQLKKRPAAWWLILAVGQRKLL